MLATADAIGTPHEYFYFRLPAAFLVVPLLIIFADWATHKRIDRPGVWGCIAAYPLLANFVVMFGYLMVSGGGM
jgi:hypothetical protein